MYFIVCILTFQTFLKSMKMLRITAGGDIYGFQCHFPFLV